MRAGKKPRSGSARHSPNQRVWVNRSQWCDRTQARALRYSFWRGCAKTRTEGRPGRNSIAGGEQLGQPQCRVDLSRDLLCQAEKIDREMALRRKITGGALALIGYMLSPLSWWNDMFVNVPLALVFAWVVSAFYKPAFGPAMVIGYWLTNVLGFVLMHKGAQQMFSDRDRRYSRVELLKDVAISLIYTLIIVGLIKVGVLKPFQNYFGSG